MAGFLCWEAAYYYSPTHSTTHSLPPTEIRLRQAAPPSPLVVICSDRSFLDVSHEDPDSRYSILIQYLLTINLPLLSVGARDNHFLAEKSITRAVQGVGHENRDF